jgi:hypothetical protein
VVSTRLGAEGLCTSSGYPCEVADEPKQFAAAVIKLLEDPSGAAQLALQARQFVEGERNVHAATAKLEATYRHELLRRVKPAASF